MCTRCCGTGSRTMFVSCTICMFNPQLRCASIAPNCRISTVTLSSDVVGWSLGLQPSQGMLAVHWQPMSVLGSSRPCMQGRAQPTTLCVRERVDAQRGLALPSTLLSPSQPISSLPPPTPGRAPPRPPATARFWKSAIVPRSQPAQHQGLLRVHC